MLSIIYFFLGASLGSFIGLVCDRFPEESIVTPSSHCSFCKHSLRFFEMVPVFSQLILKSRCRFCQKPIPYRYLFIELFCGVVCLLFLHHFLDFAEAYFIIFSCLLGLIYFLVSKDLKQKIAFVPFLFVSILFLTFIK